MCIISVNGGKKKNRILQTGQQRNQWPMFLFISALRSRQFSPPLPEACVSAPKYETSLRSPFTASADDKLCVSRDTTDLAWTHTAPQLQAAGMTWSERLWAASRETEQPSCSWQLTLFCCFWLDLSTLGVFFLEKTRVSHWSCREMTEL